MGMDIVSEVVNSSNRVELALVLDNTGSMNCGNDRSSGCTANWSRPRLVEPHRGAEEARRRRSISTSDADDDASRSRSVKIGARAVRRRGQYRLHSSDNVAVLGRLERRGERPLERAQLRQAQLLSTGATCTTGSTCKYVGHKWLFNKLHGKNSSVKWAGCVEMRAEPYDILDTTPTSSTPDTLFVPFFWPDEPDHCYHDDRASPDTKQNTSYSSGRSSGTYHVHQRLSEDKADLSDNAAGAQKSLRRSTILGSSSNVSLGRAAHTDTIVSAMRAGRTAVARGRSFR